MEYSYLKIMQYILWEFHLRSNYKSFVNIKCIFMSIFQDIYTYVAELERRNMDIYHRVMGRYAA